MRGDPGGSARLAGGRGCGRARGHADGAGQPGPGDAARGRAHLARCSTSLVRAGPGLAADWVVRRIGSPCCAPTAIIAARRSSTGVAPTGLTSSSGSRRPRPYGGMSSAWKPARWRATPPPRRRTKCAVIPRPGDQNSSQADPAFLRFEPTGLPSSRQVPINEIWYEVDQTPAHHTVDGRNGPLLDDGLQGRAMRVGEFRGLAGRLAVDQARGPLGVELHHPVAHDLHRAPADPGRRGAGCPLIDRRQGQQAPGLRAVLRRAGDRAQRMGIKVCPERNRHGEPPSFATLNQTCLKPTRPNRVTPSGTWYQPVCMTWLFLIGATSDHDALGLWKYVFVALFAVLIAASVAIAVENWREDASQRTGTHLTSAAQA